MTSNYTWSKGEEGYTVSGEGISLSFGSEYDTQLSKPAIRSSIEHQLYMFLERIDVGLSLSTAYPDIFADRVLDGNPPSHCDVLRYEMNLPDPEKPKG